MWSSEKLAVQITEFDRSSVPLSAKHKVVDLVIDVVGAAAAGVINDSAKASRAVCREVFGGGPSLVWFTGERLNSCAAAFVNSAAASALDIDDGHRKAIGHPGAPIIPAMLAEAEAIGASAEDLISAIVLGYEVGIRVAAAQYDRPNTRMYATGRWASVAVAAGVGYLRGTSQAHLAQALAIAGTHRPNQLPSGTSKQLGHAKEGIPWATLTGFLAVSLAENGFTASLDVFDIAELFEGKSISNGIGAEYKIEGTYTKPYSCCRWIHAAIDGLLFLMDAHNVSSEEVDSITVYTIGAAVRLNNKCNPAAHFEAQFSVPYCLAVAAICGAEALLTPDTDLLQRTDLISFAEKVALEIDLELDHLFPERTGARVAIMTKNGVLEHQVDFPRGDPANPMTRDEIVHKFHRLCEYGLGKCAANQLTESIGHIQANMLHDVPNRISRVRFPS